MARQMKGGRAEVAPGQIAVAAGDWAAAESLGKAVEDNAEAAANEHFGISFLAVARPLVGTCVRLSNHSSGSSERTRKRDDTSPWNTGSGAGCCSKWSAAA